MTDHKTATREQWLAARLELLEAEAHPHRPVVYRNVAHRRALLSRPQSRRLR